MKILQVSPLYYPSFGGIEEHVRNISEKLSCFHDLTVATTDPSGTLFREETINNVKVKRFRSWAPSNSYHISPGLYSYLSKHSESFDLVHAHGYHQIPAFCAALTKGKNKFVFTPHYHGKGNTFFRSALHTPYKPFGRKIFDKSDRIVCVSKCEKLLVTENFGVPDEKIVIIPNGIDWSEFKTLKREKRNNGSKIILYVGRLDKYKGIDYLVKALPKLDKTISLEIVGRGPQKRDIVELVSKLGVANRVRFYQDLPRKKLLKKYVEADIVALLSNAEAFAITIAEALAAGTRCLVTDTQALSEWVDNEGCFGLSYPIDLEELVKITTNLINKSNKNFRYTGKNILDWSEIARRLEKQVYNSF